MSALRGALTSRFAGWAAVLLAGLAACQGVEFGVGVKPAVPPSDPAVVKQVEDAKVAVGEATQADLEQARRRATEAATAATQAKERADRARSWTDDFSARVTAANERLTKAEAAWRPAAGAGLNVDGPKDTTPWGLLSWAISTGLLVVLNEKRKREAKAVLDAAKQESADVVARQDDAPFVGSGGKLEPEHRLADTPSRLDAVEAALTAAGVLKRP